MTSVKAALLFVGNPTLVLEHFVTSLEKRLAPLGITVEELSPEPGAALNFHAAGSIVSVCANATPLPADSFTGAMDSPLSRPVLGLLAETLARHSRHMMISVERTENTPEKPAELLTRLQVAHATTALLAEWHMPAALHWMQSNQLLTGAQYLQIAADPTPWALFAQAHVTFGGEQDEMERTHGVRLDEAKQFIGKPIRFVETSLPLEEIHAASLSFLRHAVQTGVTIPNGHTFGASGGQVFRVRYIDANEDLPNGMYELSVVQNDTGAALGNPARLPRAIQIHGDMTLPDSHSLTGIAAPHPRERTRSMAIGYLMLVIMPPVGAILLMSNAIFGSNVFRTGVVAAASVAVAVVVGTYTFMNGTQQTALLFDSNLINSSILTD